MLALYSDLKCDAYYISGSKTAHLSMLLSVKIVYFSLYKYTFIKKLQLFEEI